jgi:hypothetical protein
MLGAVAAYGHLAVAIRADLFKATVMGNCLPAVAVTPEISHDSHGVSFEIRG